MGFCLGQTTLNETYFSIVSRFQDYRSKATISRPEGVNLNHKQRARILGTIDGLYCFLSPGLVKPNCTKTTNLHTLQTIV